MKRPGRQSVLVMAAILLVVFLAPAEPVWAKNDLKALIHQIVFWKKPAKDQASDCPKIADAAYSKALKDVDAIYKSDLKKAVLKHKFDLKLAKGIEGRLAVNRDYRAAIENARLAWDLAKKESLTIRDNELAKCIEAEEQNKQKIKEKEK